MNSLAGEGLGLPKVKGPMGESPVNKEYGIWGVYNGTCLRAHLEKFPSSAARETGYEEMFALTKGTLDPGSKRQVEKT